jgi:GAF domain-containing protein
MTVGDQVIGVISVESEIENAFDQNNQILLETLAQITASAIHRTRLYKQTERQLRHLEALRDIDLAITSVIDMKMILELMVGV